jgi:hypothetical protein
MKKKVISQDIINLCNNFAEKCCLTNVDEYSKRNQKDFNKIKKDIAIGKIAEFGVYFIFLEQGMSNISIPDINVYSSNKKSFDADLECNKINFHIKTQTIDAAKKFENSWLFQKNDPLVLKPQNNDYFIGTQYDEENFEVKILLSKKAKDLKYNKPVLEKLFSKTCVYLKNNL